MAVVMKQSHKIEAPTLGVDMRFDMTVYGTPDTDLAALLPTAASFEQFVRDVQRPTPEPERLRSADPRCSCEYQRIVMQSGRVDVTRFANRTCPIHALGDQFAATEHDDEHD